MSLTNKPGIMIAMLSMFLTTSVAAEMVPLEQDEMACMLEPNTEIEISAAVPGVLDKVLVQRGSRVKSGQVLAKLVSGTERAAVELAKARVEFGKRKAERNAELYKEELISIHEKDEMDTEVQISKLQLVQSKEQLKLRNIVSPINGVVVEREKDPGEYVEIEPLLTVVSLDPLNVEVVVSSERFGSIKEGMPGKVTTVGPMSATYDAKVVLIDQVIDAASDTIRVRLALPNPKNAIPAGLKCNVKFMPKKKLK